MDLPKRPNKFGYAVGLCLVLAVSFLVVGGTSYALYSVLSFVTGLFIVSWAMRRTRTRSRRDTHRDHDSEKSDATKRREKEMQAEAGGYGGNGGGT
ncbi:MULTISPECIES: hypothetical protein [Haloferax]|uniref:Uncharacterized protein n=2 Tax=Haloferax TaxID=2251 RepID=A0A6G1YZD1_9EURY|nr:MULTISPECIES: hypothetical protein [Haloferax]KAB1186991.1 hypothetical protein Hfx1149_02675 [Haloferax sp. CBA1149]MRW79623.1 hypothetical protein [Haloferax marinisediminis]